jgi:hypothetical protein
VGNERKLDADIHGIAHHDVAIACGAELRWKLVVAASLADRDHARHAARGFLDDVLRRAEAGRRPGRELPASARAHRPRDRGSCAPLRDRNSLRIKRQRGVDASVLRRFDRARRAALSGPSSVVARSCSARAGARDRDDLRGARSRRGERRARHAPSRSRPRRARDESSRRRPRPRAALRSHRRRREDRGAAIGRLRSAVLAARNREHDRSRCASTRASTSSGSHRRRGARAARRAS